MIRKGVLTVESSATLMDVAEKMTRLNVSLLVIVDKRGEPIDVISERDIVKAVADRLTLIAPALPSSTMSLTISTLGLTTAAKRMDVVGASESAYPLA